MGACALAAVIGVVGRYVITWRAQSQVHRVLKRAGVEIHFAYVPPSPYRRLSDYLNTDDAPSISNPEWKRRIVRIAGTTPGDAVINALKQLGPFDGVILNDVKITRRLMQAVCQGGLVHLEADAVVLDEGALSPLESCDNLVTVRVVSREGVTERDLRSLAGNATLRCVEISIHRSGPSPQSLLAEFRHASLLELVGGNWLRDTRSDEQFSCMDLRPDMFRSAELRDVLRDTAVRINDAPVTPFDLSEPTPALKNLLSDAEQREAAGKVDDAIRVLEGSLHEHAWWFDGALTCARLRLYRGDRFQAVLEDAERAISAGPWNSAGYTLKGDAYGENGRWAEALQEYEKAKLRSTNDERPECDFAIGRALFALGRDDESLITFVELGKSLDVRTSHYAQGAASWIHATSSRASVYDGKQAVKLVEAAKAKRASWKRDWAFLEIVAAAHAANGDFSKACEAQESAIAFANSGRAAMTDKRKNEAIAELSQELTAYQARQRWRSHGRLRF